MCWGKECLFEAMVLSMTVCCSTCSIQFVMAWKRMLGSGQNSFLLLLQGLISDKDLLNTE
jgi:hypothetical protein